MASYKPNYTSAEYKYADPEIDYSGTSPRSMSTWCSACHTAYNNKPDFAVALADGAISYGAFEQDTDSAEQVGSRTRHRHPVDISIDGATQAKGFGSTAVTSTLLPLADGTDADAVRGVWSTTDYIDCLTCHRAHGTASQMTGWANARLVNRAVPAGRNDSWTVEPHLGAPAGVNPNFTSALLRTDNRGVCERCHNK